MLKKVGLKKELEAKRDKSLVDSENVVEEVKLLMAGDANKEKDALRAAGLDHHVKQVESDKGVEIERKQLEDTYKDLVFTKSEIKDICIKYDLRFLRTGHFKGKLDTEIATKLKNFMADNPEIGHDSDSFYIIAPGKAFDLKDRPAKPFIDIDPILVYKVPKEDKYVYIHKWGRDFTVARKLRGMFFESRASMWTMAASAWIITLSTIFGLLFGGFTGEWVQYLNLLWIVGVSFGLAFATLGIMFNDGEDFDERATSYVWDNTMSRR